MTFEELLESTDPLVSVPDAGEAVFKVGPSAAYAMAARGELPILRVGERRVFVIRAKLLESLGYEP